MSDAPDEAPLDRPAGGWRGVALLAAVAAVIGLAPLAGRITGEAVSPVAVDFDREIRPILAGNCLRCHGGVRELAGLHLGERERALRPDAKGHAAIVPGHPERSELIRRVNRTDEGRMPPSGEPLPPVQLATLRRWIAEGAPFEPPWSLQPPVAPRIPAVRGEAWIAKPLDRFVLARLEQARLRPAAEAERATLLRRVSLDLVGLPPTVAELDAFLADSSPTAYAQVVDRLLASPRYGERWARPWLDLARYADTKGYEKDARREIWAYRDWVIGALNRDMPYDQFVVRQLAGDLLPGASDDDRAATAFHRNTLTNDEGGTDDEEFRMTAVIDRVAVTWQGLMGTTFQCAQCHGHPYDPFSHEEYFRFFAFLNQTEDRDRDDEEPVLRGRPPFWAERAIAAAARLEPLGRDEVLGRLTAEPPGQPPLSPDLSALIARPTLEWSDGEAALARLATAREDPEVARELATLAPTSVPVLRELSGDARRVTHLLERGSLRKPGGAVEPGVPAAMHPWPEGEPADRLGLARWTASAENPLFARVAVNRIWETLFGRGLVETGEDFGSLGLRPEDPALLDYLATRLVELGWSQKALLREIALSATYRQSSVASAEARAADPENRLWSRSPRRRLEAEAIRDSTLAVSGLLSERMYGPSVMPPQPDGVWAIVYSDDRWTVSEGEDRHRRAIYTFWRRSSPYPSLVAFDAPSRETCTVRRSPSNSPLAALAMLNDPVVIEAAGQLAFRALRDSIGPAPPDRIAAAMLRAALLRDPRPDEVERLLVLQRAERARMEADDAARASLGSDADRAAWTLVASAVLNLDEFLSRP